ncbi:MAG: alkyl hydroperoxide reductase [Gemmatimonadaceae bacterium]
MRELELAYAKELAVVGVHSGKFIAERVTDRIRDASLRLGTMHPIVNDRQYRTWRSYAVNAWPTIVMVDPRGYVLGQHSGEFTAEQIAPFLESMIAASSAKDEIVRGTKSFPVLGPVHPAGPLCYPQGVAIDGARIAIADTGHHRVLVGTLDQNGTAMRVRHVVGSGISGFDDGSPGSFDSPCGMAFGDSELYVADAGNHAIRAINLDTGALRTVAGTGHELRTAEDAAAGALSSPWDVTIRGGTLYVAMAGTHQLYAIDPVTGASRVHAGNRSESLLDAPLLEAALAQPMGIASDGSRLYFADSESSAIRSADIDPAGAVHTFVGTGLFDFGDVDGTGDTVKLQHAQGIALHPDGRILIADSYNDALKWLDPATRRVTTWVRNLHEPSSVACGDEHAYVADTNAHRVNAVDYRIGTACNIDITLAAAWDTT